MFSPEDTVDESCYVIGNPPPPPKRVVLYSWALFQALKEAERARCYIYRSLQYFLRRVVNPLAVIPGLACQKWSRCFTYSAQSLLQGPQLKVRLWTYVRLYPRGWQDGPATLG
ncbi:hypothetical protein R1flu_017461 [Riccia fluitans]|uniref:Uncharacterized protein n=1 Tax=Riccia fluitans TaxID=41844 RepID=A0ABD1ZD44_9MARC